MTKVKLIKVVKGGKEEVTWIFKRNREDYLVRTILFNLYCFMAKRITVKFGWWWCIVRFFETNLCLKAHLIQGVGYNYFE